jgi:nucleoside-diphosphate-sugar epimerase/predicted dehydrogenase
VDPSQDSLRKLREADGVADLQQIPFEEYLADRQSTQAIDAVVVALPHHLHESAVCLALQRGLHVLVEKPFTLTVSSARIMCEQAQAAKRVLAVCHYRRHFPSNLAIGDLIKSGRLGACLSLDWREGGSYAWPVESLSQLRKENGGEVLFDIGAHVLEVITSWFGECTLLSCVDDGAGGAASSFELEMQAKDVPIHIALSRRINWGNKARIMFQMGEVVWNTQSPDRFQVSDVSLSSARCEWVFNAANQSSVIDFFKAELKGFSDSIRVGSSAFVSGEMAAGYVSVLERCENLRPPAAPQQPTSSVMPWPLKSRSIAVSGSSGFIGGRLTEMAQQRGLNVTAMARHPASCIGLLSNNIEPKMGDILHKKYLADCFRNCSAVFHCAVSWTTADMEASIVEGTKNVLEVALAEGVQRVVVLGSMMAHGQPPSSGLVDETYKGHGHDPYGKAKSRMAHMVERFSEKHTELQVVIMEPTCVFGPRGDAFVQTPIKQMLSEEFYLIDSGKGIANLVYIDNLVDALFLAAISPDLSGKRFIINEEEHGLTWATYFSKFAETLGIAPLASCDKEFLLRESRTKFKQKGGAQLFREAVRSYKPCAEYVSKHPLFRFYRRLRGTSRDKQGTKTTVQSWKRETQGCIRVKAPSQIPHPAFVELFSSDATYSSAAFRAATGWAPAEPLERSLDTTLRWARQVFPRW